MKIVRKVKEGARSLIEAMAERMVRVLSPERWRGNEKLRDEILELSSGDREAVRTYYIQKMSGLIRLGLVLIPALILLIFLHFSLSEPEEISALARPGYGKGTSVEIVTASAAGEEERELTVNVAGRKYTGEEVSRLLDEAEEELEEKLTGSNPSRDEVRGPLWFPSRLKEGAVTVTWLTMPYGILADDGSIRGEVPEEGTLVEIQASLQCQEEKRLYETAVMVFPPILPEKEAFWKQVEEQLKKADQADPDSETILLPSRVSGKRIQWTKTAGVSIAGLLLILFCIPVLLYVREDQKIHEQARKRRAQLELDYASLLWKMAMLMGAGMTIRGACTRIAGEYQRAQERRQRPGIRKEAETRREGLFGRNRTGASPPADRKAKEVRYVYEELGQMCHEMNHGVAERAAYENFGKRCALPCYVKLGSLLSQNLQKGARGLTQLLEKEAIMAMEERKNAARKLGEEAETKLLFPMIGMLGVVLGILIVPAFLSL